MFTPHQEAAIAARGNVLVMAGAGTGKTRTIVERCVRWLLEPGAGNSLDQILMVTFTDAAATEMRHRIRVELTRRLEELPPAPASPAAESEGAASLRAHLAEQLALLELASISTLHSFCFQLVRQHFYELEVDPQLSILPEAEAALLAEETLETIFERHYAGRTPRAEEVQELVQNQSRGWDVPIRNLVLRLHAYRQTLPNAEQWLRQQLAHFEAPHPIQWRDWLARALTDWCAQWIPLLNAQPLENVNARQAAALLRKLADTLATPASGDGASSLNSCAALLDELGHVNDNWPKGKKTVFRQPMASFFDELGFLATLFPAQDGADPLQEDWNWVRGNMRALLELSAEFSADYAQAKKELGAVDFHDLEQLTLKLLWHEEEQRATALAAGWRRRFKLVFVDEYQDINLAQDRILRALSREGAEANRFLVGDVKQSIYRFRLANPRIFQGYAQAWHADRAEGRIIPLQENFRSHQILLEFINGFFTRVMRPSLGGIHYDEEARLAAGSPETRLHATAAGERDLLGAVQPHPLPHVELHLILTGRSEEEGEGETDNFGPAAPMEKSEREARLIVRRLARLKAEGHPVWDEKARRHRPVEWRDMVILMRSPAGNADAFAKEFSHAGIPLQSARGGFFDSMEVMDLLALLTVLDNPLQDVPLLAVLRSPMVGLTVDELAILRLASPGRLWLALVQLAERAEGVARTLASDEGIPAVWIQSAAGKVKAFLDRQRRWRRIARESSLSQCLETAMNETHYASWLAGQPRGRQAVLNVAKLQHWVRQFDQFHRQGLYRFLRFVEAQRAAEVNPDGAPAEGGEAVRLMSIHQSKGLEFPVVVLADLGRRFNLSDLRGDIILDEDLGLCPLVKPPRSGQRYPSLPYWLARKRQRSESLGEELRLLYVGMTRAVQALILTGTTTVKTARERWPEKALNSSPGAEELASASSSLDWLGPWLPSVTGATDWVELPSGAKDWFLWTVQTEADLAVTATVPPTATAPVTIASVAPTEDAICQLRERLTWQYPFASAVQTPAKLSVSAVRRMQSEQPLDSAPWRGRRQTAPRAEGGTASDKLTAAEVGSAHHRFLQFASLDRLGSLSETREEAARLASQGVLSPEELKSLDLDAIASFWDSEEGRRIRKQAGHTHRELPFTLRLAPGELVRGGQIAQAAQPPAGTEADFVVLEGIVDLAVVLEDAIWLLDFKTDQVRPADLEERVREYIPQLAAYARALERIYDRPVRECWLHFLRPRRTISCLEALVIENRPRAGEAEKT